MRSFLPRYMNFSHVHASLNWTMRDISAKNEFFIVRLNLQSRVVAAFLRQTAKPLCRWGCILLLNLIFPQKRGFSRKSWVGQLFTHYSKTCVSKLAYLFAFWETCHFPTVRMKYDLISPHWPKILISLVTVGPSNATWPGVLSLACASLLTQNHWD